MVLNLIGIKNPIFEHSKRVETGVGKERVGQATVVVALDGTGDFDSIQEGIDFLPTTGGVVFIKEGTYIITSKITINKSNVSLIGTGKASEIETESDLIMISATDVNNIFIEKLFLDGAGAGKGTNDGINFNNVDDSTIKDCWIEGVGSRGIVLLGTSSFCIISGNKIENSTSAGIVTGTNNTDLIISGNRLKDNTGNGINIGSNNTIIIGNTCNSNDTGIVCVSGTANATITGNLITSNTGGGILMSNTDESIVTGNIIKDNGTGGTRDGILINSDSDNCIVSSNNCTGNTNYGINLSQNTVDKTLVHGNHLLGNTTGAFNDAGTNTTSADNVTI